MPKANDFQSFLRNRSDEIAAAGRAAGLFTHRPTKGSVRERILREPLRELLPSRYGLTGGEVRASDGSVSSQWDLLIYDQMNTPHLWRDDEVASLPIEGVLAAISIKSTINKAAIDDAASSAEILREMPRRQVPTSLPLAPNKGSSPAVFLFGFEGTSLATIKTQMYDAGIGEGSPSLINAACVLDKGVVAPVNVEGNVDSPNIQGWRIGHAAQGGAWGIFVAILWSTLMYLSLAPVAPLLLSYIDAGGLLDPPDASGESIEGAAGQEPD